VFVFGFRFLSVVFVFLGFWWLCFFSPCVVSWIVL
jgi:hypothetical protein